MQSARHLHSSPVLPRMREWIEIRNCRRDVDTIFVLPRMREWIEIKKCPERAFTVQVLPRMREWIEMVSPLIPLNA